VLHALGLTGELAGYAAAADSRLGRVLGVPGGVVTVLTEDGPLHAGLGGGLLRAVAADRDTAPCAGDWVLLRDWPDHRVTLERVLPRRTTLRGEAPDGPVVAANVDLVGVLVRPVPLPSAATLRTTLARAAAGGAAPVLVLTGAEHVEDTETLLAGLAMRVAGLGPRPVSRVAVSTSTHAGVEALRDLLEGRTLALVGARAADRAALCRALTGGTVPLRQPSVAPWLQPLPGGGAVLDAGATARPAHPRLTRGGDTPG
jgi:ribosome biogenesis GTPase